MTNSAPARFRWDGPYRSVVVVLPSGRVLSASWAEEIEALPNEAEALASLQGWTRVDAPPAPDHQPEEGDSQ